MQRSRRKLAALRMILAAVTVEKNFTLPSRMRSSGGNARKEQDSRGRILACGEQVTSSLQEAVISLEKLTMRIGPSSSAGSAAGEIVQRAMV